MICHNIDCVAERNAAVPDPLCQQFDEKIAAGWRRFEELKMSCREGRILEHIYDVPQTLSRCRH
jgi:hypothetical protein